LEAEKTNVAIPSSATYSLIATRAGSSATGTVRSQGQQCQFELALCDSFNNHTNGT